MQHRWKITSDVNSKEKSESLKHQESQLSDPVG